MWHALVIEAEGAHEFEQRLAAALNDAQPVIYKPIIQTQIVPDEDDRNWYYATVIWWTSK